MIRTWNLTGWMLLAVLGWARDGLAQGARTPSDVVGAVLAQANTEYGLYGAQAKTFSAAEFLFRHISLSPLDGVYIAQPQLSNGRHPYTVARVGERLFRLGGFHVPELIPLSNEVVSLHETADVTTQALLLTRLADPHGAVEFLKATGSSPCTRASEVRSAWYRVRPANWPTDTLMALPDGSLLLNLTVLSRAVEGDFADGWDPILYRMAFSRTERLLAWSSRISERFAAPSLTQDCGGE